MSFVLHRTNQYYSSRLAPSPPRPDPAEGRENYQQQLRQALPAFVEDSQLREALAQCEVAIRAGEAAWIEHPAASASAEAARFVGSTGGDSSHEERPLSPSDFSFTSNIYGMVDEASPKREWVASLEKGRDRPRYDAAPNMDCSMH